MVVGRSVAWNRPTQHNICRTAVVNFSGRKWYGCCEQRHNLTSLGVIENKRVRHRHDRGLPQRHLTPLLPLPQPRPHPRRRPRRLRIRPPPHRHHGPGPTAGRRTSSHADNPDPRWRTPRRRTGPAGPQTRRHRCRTAPPHRPLNASRG